MPLDELVQEIRSRSDAEIREANEKIEAERRRLEEDRARRLAAIEEESEKQTELEVARLRAQKRAGAKLQARKLLYETREKRMTQSLEETRAMLREYAESPEYKAVLERMHEFALQELGKGLRISGRKEDASLLRGVAGKNFDPTPAPILGGVIAATADGARRLNLSFDELLRLREDRVRELLAT